MFFPYIIASIILVLIFLLAKQVMGMTGLIILFSFILVAYIAVLIIIGRARKNLVNQLQKLDTDLRNNLRQELEKEGILGKKP